jgi:hypothetical protein
MHFYRKLNAATGRDAIFLKSKKGIRGFEAVCGLMVNGVLRKYGMNEPG